MRRVIQSLACMAVAFALTVPDLRAEAKRPRPLPGSGPVWNIDKDDLEWDEFEGKVVIVDFWNQH